MFFVRITIRQDILHHFEQIIPQEKSTGWLLHTFNHIEQIGQDCLNRSFFSFDVGSANSNQEVESGDDGTGVLNAFVKVCHFATLFLFVNEVRFKLSEFVENHHIKIKVVFGSKS